MTHAPVPRLHPRARPAAGAASAALWTLLALAATTPQAQAATCDEIARGVESRIRASGVTAFEVSVVDAEASAPGQTVGRCDFGRRKIIYTRHPADHATAPRPPAPAPAPAPSPTPTSPHPPSPPVITECADGRVLTDANCN